MERVESYGRRKKSIGVRANADAFTPHECDRCDDAHKQAWCCPDFNLRRAEPIDIDGVLFDQCPGYWKRSDVARWGELAHMVDVRSAYEIAVESRFALEHGALGSITGLPGKLRDAISIVMSIEAQNMRRQMDESRQSRDGKTRLKIV